MPFQSSTSSFASALHGLRSAHAMKQALQDPLNFDFTSPDVAGVPSPLRTNPAREDDVDDRERVNDIRPRCDSGQSIPTIWRNEPGTVTASGGRKRMCTEPSPVFVKRKTALKRSYAVRDLRFDGYGHDEGHSHGLGEFNGIEGSTLVIPTRKDDGPAAWVAPDRPMATLPMRARGTRFKEIIDLIADQEAAKNQNLIARSAFGALGLSARFEVSIKMKAKDIVMWDVDLNQTYALEGMLYVKDAKAQTTRFPLSPVDSISIEWRTVDSCQRVPSMADDAIYATSFRGGVVPSLTRDEVLRDMDPANGICKDVRWERIPPRITGTGRGGDWALRFWVPVPLWILKGRDMARSLISASVVFRDGDNDDTFTADAGTVDVTIEHRVPVCAQDRKVFGRS